MVSSRRRSVAFALATVFSLMSLHTTAAAQSIGIVHAFQTLPAQPVGELLELAPNLYLGASRRGGAYDLGTVYALFRRADATWGTYVVHSFSADDGTPASGVIRASNGHFYGTTENGGAMRQGAVYRITSAGVFATLHSFTDAEGRYPLSPLVEGPDGFLWGTTTNFGPTGAHGTIFKMTPSGTLTVVRALTEATGSGMLSALVRGADGRLYGATPYGGDPSGFGGVIFRITTSGSLTVLHQFSSNEYGPKWIRAGLDGNIYGVIRSGGAVSSGLFFGITLAGAVTYIRSFVRVDPGDVWFPNGAPLQRPDGAFYGVAEGSGPPFQNSSGGVYRMTLTAAPREIGSFGGSFGTYGTGLIAASDGALVGTTQLGEWPPSAGRVYSPGAAFRISSTEPLTHLYAFGADTARHPAGALTEGPDGRLYGTTCRGGRYNLGTVYRLDGTGPTTLHSFSGDDGACPMSGVTFGVDGAMFGTTVFSVNSPYGRIFRISADTTFTVLWQPPAESWRYLFAAPTTGPDGALYVTASGVYGGGPGGVLRIADNGTVTEFAEMVAGVSGWWPVSALTLANDGHLYGTTAEPNGGIYRLTPDGTVSGVHMFPTPASLAFRSGVIQGMDGRLYGSVTQSGGATLGAVYASTLTGDVTILHEFQGPDGVLPWGELLEASTGRFLGVTYGSGNPAADPFGSIFEVTAEGGFATVHSFSSLDGANPLGSLMRASDGSIYGTTYRGGPLGGGVIFRIVPAAK